MALNALWITVLCVAHVTGVSLLIYSVEQTFGWFGRLFACKLQRAKTRAKSEGDIGDTNKVSPPQAIEFRWKDVKCWTKGGEPKQILQNCFGGARSGETVAIMGPSGAGKSTLMELLYGQQRGYRIEGQVFLDGRKANASSMRKIASMVTQQDVFMPTLSVEETLLFRADLIAAIDLHDVQSSLDSILMATGLRQTRYTKVGGLLPGGIDVKGISGGEKRRLSIACALMSDPQILFLDEPTSGLDSFSALRVMQHVFEVAKTGKIVFASIHQPRMEIFTRMSNIVLLSEGRQIYFGHPESAVSWFAQLGYTYRAGGVSVSDWLLDTVSVGFDRTVLDDPLTDTCMSTMDDIQMAAEAFANQFKEGYSDDDPEKGGQSFPKATHGAEKRQTTKVEWHKQFWVLLRRAFLAQIRNPTDTASRLLLATWIGLLTGLVFHDLSDAATSSRARLSVIFYVLLLFQLLPFSFMSFFVADRRFFLADVTTNLYTPSAYFVAASMASYPFVVLNTASGSLIAYGLSGLRSTVGSVVLYVCFVCLQALVSQQLLIFCVWATSNQDMAYVLSTGYVALCILLSGFFIRIKDVSIGFVKALSWASYPKYSMMALARLELQGRVWSVMDCQQSSKNIGDTNDKTSPISEAVLFACNATGDEQLSYYGYDVPVAVDCAAIVAFWLALAIGSFVALSLKARR